MRLPRRLCSALLPLLIASGHCAVAHSDHGAVIATFVSSGLEWMTTTVTNEPSDDCQCHCYCKPASDGPSCSCQCDCDDEESGHGEMDGAHHTQSSFESVSYGSHGSEDHINGEDGIEHEATHTDEEGSEDISTTSESGRASDDGVGVGGALIPGLIKTNHQPMFVVDCPNPLDPSLHHHLDENNHAHVKMCKNDNHYTGLVDDNNNPLKTSVYGYGEQDQECTWPGKTFEARVNKEYSITWDNQLPKEKYILTGLNGESVVDTTIHWAYSLHGYEDYTIEKDGTPAVVHVHGSMSASEFDGNPEDFFSPNYEIKGPMYRSNTNRYTPHNPKCMWYHDHTLGITRLNVYAGLAGLYFVRDEMDTGEPDNPLHLPAYPYEVAFVIQDRMFKEDGSLFYPAFPGDPNYEGFIDDEGAQLPPDKFANGGPTVLAEFFGDVMTVNGKIWPKFDVEPRKYRLRMVNGCDSRYMVVQFVKVPLDATEIPADADLLEFTVIGTDHGYAFEPRVMTTMVFEPAARYDVIIDFAAYDGYRIVLKNIGNDTPFDGTWSPTGPDRPGTVFQRTDRIMAFDVINAFDASVPDDFDPDIVRSSSDMPEPSRTRKVGLFEGKDQYGRLQPLLGAVEPATDYRGEPIYWPTTDAHIAAGLAGKQMEGTASWHDTTTENPALGATEEWEIWNFSEDAHPIHLHLVSFKILHRETIVWDSSTEVEGEEERVRHPDEVNGDGTYLIEQPLVEHDGSLGMGYRVGNPTKGEEVSAPDEFFQEGYKDMVIALPGEVTHIVATFSNPGHYNWHCHILSHEDHDMMRVLHVGDDYLMRKVNHSS
jgi:spore coat protein A, manganese oxidase